MKIYVRCMLFTLNVNIHIYSEKTLVIERICNTVLSKLRSFFKPTTYL